MTHPGRGGYTEAQCIQALRDFEARTGRPPTCNEWREWHLTPSHQALVRQFGSWGNAMIAAGMPALPRGGEDRARYEEAERIAARVAAGESLARIGREMGVSGQNLGRRVKRWRALRERGFV